MTCEEVSDSFSYHEFISTGCNKHVLGQIAVAASCSTSGTVASFIIFIFFTLTTDLVVVYHHALSLFFTIYDLINNHFSL